MLRAFLFIGLVAYCLVAAATGQAQGQAKNQRALLALKHAGAKELAEVLGKHFQGEAGVQILPESSTNGLLITAPPTVMKEIHQLVQQLDRSPRSIAVELLVAEIPLPKGGDGKVEIKDFTGPGAQVAAKLEALQKQGLVSDLRRIQLNAVENQPTTSTKKSDVPYTSNSIVSTAVDGVPRVTRTVAYRPVGTVATVTARLEGEKIIVLDLSYEESRLFAPDSGIPIGKDEAGVSIKATEFVNNTLKTRVQVADGNAVAIQGATTSSRAGPAITVVVVTATLRDTVP